MQGKRKREPGLQVHFADGDVMPIVVPASRFETIIRISKAANGATNINAPKHVTFIKADKRPKKVRR